MLSAATKFSAYRPPLQPSNFTWEEEEDGFCHFLLLLEVFAAAIKFSADPLATEVVDPKVLRTTTSLQV